VVASRRGRRGTRGAEAIEFIACIALLLFALTLGEQAIALMRLQAVAENDARALARLAALCDATHPATLSSVDPDNGDPPSTWNIDRSGPLVAATVVLRPVAMLPVINGLTWQPRAHVVMAREQGCARG
jgi:hypothetical protein